MDGETRVGVDVGGTFTDVVTVADGELRVHKSPSTPDAPEEGVLDGFAGAADRAGIDPSDVGYFAHGTTVATNAVLEEEWADTALLTTEGFRDVLEIGRQDRPDLYDLTAEKPEPVAPRERRYEVPERRGPDGEVRTPLDEDAVRGIAADLDADAVAVCLLFSYADDGHERRVAEILESAGVDAALSLSTDVLPEIREYERTSATTLNAALKPVMDAYLGRLDRGLRDAGVPAALRIMQSNGGIMTADAARTRPVTTLLSGPAAGVRGAAHVAERAGLADVVTMDMGGTSCDVSLVTGGDPVVTTDTEVGDHPVPVPSVDVHTVGSGGGSIAWVDDGGALRVGPRSAGADPGPVCYGRGGEAPTTTDAHAVLGRIAPERFLDDPAPPGAVRGAVESVAEPLGGDPIAAAEGILEVAHANMERALRVVSVERGHDPRDFSLVAFGGAGPLHAAALAESLGMPRVLVPRTAGVLSALGLLVSDVVYDDGRSRVTRLEDADPGALSATYESLESDGRDRLADASVPEPRRHLERSADLRYVGQSFDLTVPVPRDLDEDALETLAERFHERHRRRYGHAAPEEPVELVTVRVRARGAVEPPDLELPDRGGAVADAVRETREVHFDGEFRETRVYDRGKLPPGAEVDGPCVVEGSESTAVVRPGQRLAVDGDGNLVVEVSP